MLLSYFPLLLTITQNKINCIKYVTLNFITTVVLWNTKNKFYRYLTTIFFTNEGMASHDKKNAELGLVYIISAFEVLLLCAEISLLLIIKLTVQGY